MNPVLIAFCGALLVPLFVASWRLSLFGLAVQGLLMAWVSYELDPSLDSLAAWTTMFDLVVVRGLGAPIALYAVLRAQRATARHDVIPPNLMTWTLAVALVLVAFRFADMLVPLEGNEHSFVASASAAILLGLLVLATQTGPFSQMVGALRIENGIAMFELGVHHDPAMQIAQTIILITTILLFRWYLTTLPRTATAKVSAVEGMNL
ncbi:MAG TPA: hypothetical protein VN253_16275 [Kofleriaceae bacterium]|nr:hypothetical protein [Kofleriaceae bacterium]